MKLFCTVIPSLLPWSVCRLAKVIGLRFTDFIPAEFPESLKKLLSKGWESDSKGEILFKNKNNDINSVSAIFYFAGTG